MNKHVNYETDLLSYRLRTARQRKRMQYKGFEKKLRALDREEDALYEQQAGLGWAELRPPVQRGWKRYFVLRDDVARSKHADFFQRILNRINTTHWSNTKDFKVKRRRSRQDEVVDRRQELLEPWEDHFKKLAFTEHEKQFFIEKYVQHKWMTNPLKKFVFVEPWRFVLKVRPNWITKTRVRDEAIESRLQEIDNYMIVHNLRPKLAKQQGASYNRRHWRYEEIRKDTYEFKNKSLVQILDKIKES